ncbi:hypothetical protein KIH78_01010 [Bifidobacterium sp. 79T10]|nr:hypothetical protein [Bifidobacterium saguinibicoloris]MBW3079994.1 hypothetical protein [Bifidobacterium saguinibicoloris]
MRLPTDARFCARCGTDLREFMDDGAIVTKTPEPASPKPAPETVQPPSVPAPVAGGGVPPVPQDDQRPAGPPGVETVDIPVDLSIDDSVIGPDPDTPQANADGDAEQKDPSTAGLAMERWRDTRRGFLVAALLVIGGAIAIGAVTAGWSWTVVEHRNIVIACTVPLVVVAIAMAASSWHVWRIRKAAMNSGGVTGRGGVLAVILPMTLSILSAAVAVLCCVALTMASDVVSRTYFRAGIDDYPAWTPHSTLGDMFLACETSAHHDGGDIRMTYYPGDRLQVTLDGTDASSPVDGNRALAQCVWKELGGAPQRDEDVVQFFADTAGRPENDTDDGDDAGWSVTSSHYLENVDLTIETRRDHDAQADGATDKVYLDIEAGMVDGDADSVKSANALYASIVRQWAE